MRKSCLNKLLVPGLVLCATMTSAMTVNAAGPDGSELNIVELNVGDEQGYIAGFCIRAGDLGLDADGNMVITCGLSSLGVSEDDVTASFITDNNSDPGYEITAVAFDESYSLFYITDSSFSDSEPALLDTCYAEANQSVALLYFDSDSNLSCTGSTVLAADDHALKLDTDMDDLDPVYPVLILDSNTDDLVGWVMDDGTAYSIYEANFESGSSSSSGGSSSSGSESKSDSGSKETEATIIENKKAEDAPALKPIDEDSKGGFDMKLLFIGLAVFAVLVAIIVVLILKLKGSNNTGANQGTAYPPQPPYPPYSQPQRMDDISVSETVLDDDAYSTDINNGGNINQTPNNTKTLLVAKGGYMDGRIYPLEMGREITIGRVAQCSIRYPDKTAGVSRTHCKLYWMNGQLMLEDQNSSNGTYLQRIGKLNPMVPVALVPGDVFYIGEKNNAFVYQVQ